MNVVISDTAPLRYLIEIEETAILEKLFGKIIIPEKVAEELQHPKNQRKVSDWIQARPVWLEVRKADLSLFTPAKKIGDGEREAFALALELKADVVLLDDEGAEIEARRLHIPTARLFAVLELAEEKNLLDLSQVVEAIRKTSFRLPPAKTIEEMLERDQRRKEAETQPTNL